MQLPPGRPSLALAFATIERPVVAQRLIRSARRHFPDMPIYVADQSLDVSAMAHFYAEMGVRMLRMPFDAGVCASRNRLAASITEDFFVLCDDDFVLGAGTDFSSALLIMQACPDIGVIGGKLHDYDGTLQEEYDRHWELFLHLDRANRTLTSVPISQYAPRARQLGSIRYYMCDAVMNFAVMRQSIFDPAGAAAGWDERFKSNGEHEDFFLHLKQNTAVRVAYLPTMFAYHHHPEAFCAYRRRLRDRLDGWRRFLAKWDIDQHLEIGLGVRTIDDLGTVVPAAEAEARFFLNDDLSLRRMAGGTEALQVTQATRLSPIGVLDETGARDQVRPATARLLVRTGGGVRPGLEEELPPALLARQRAQAAETIRDRYDLPLEAAPGPGANVAMAFRYNPVIRDDADFVLWYRPKSPIRADRPGAARHPFLGITLRWTADDGRTLVWEGSGHALDPSCATTWQPLLVDVPLLPSGIRFARFDILGDLAGGRRPVAAGFLFAPRLQDGDPGSPGRPPAFDALAVSPGFAGGAERASWPAVDLHRLPCVLDEATLAATLSAEVPGLLLLDLTGLSSGERLLLVDWPAMGSALAYAAEVPQDGAGHAAAWPTRIAVPRPHMHGIAPRLLLHRPQLGFCNVRLTGAAAETALISHAAESATALLAPAG